MNYAINVAVRQEVALKIMAPDVGLMLQSTIPLSEGRNNIQLNCFFIYFMADRAKMLYDAFR